MIREPYFERYGARHWAVYDEDNSLIAVTVYKKGALEVIKRLKFLNEIVSKTKKIIEEVCHVE